MINLIIFGPPGAGKGTQAQIIAKKYKLTHLSSGDILRQELKNGELGKKIKKYQDAGQLVPDSIIIAMMEKAATNKIKGRGFIFDGYPRNIRQAKSLDKFFKSHKISLGQVLNLRLSEVVAIRRIILRGKTSGRSDDNLKTIKSRYKVYRTQTAPLLEYYRAQKKITNIDGQLPIMEAFAKIETVIAKIAK